MSFALSNEFVNNFRGKMSPIQSRLFFGILQESDNRKTLEFEMDSKDFFKLKGAKNMTKKRVIENMYKVLKEGVAIANAESEKVSVIAPFEYIKYDEKNKKLDVKVTKTFNNLYTNKQGGFTTLNLEQMGRLRTSKAINLYILANKVKNYKDKNKRPIPMKIDKFKSYLGVSRKMSISNLETRVLREVIPQINNFTDIEIKYEIDETKKHITLFVKEYKNKKYLTFNEFMQGREYDASSEAIKLYDELFYRKFKEKLKYSAGEWKEYIDFILYSDESDVQDYIEYQIEDAIYLHFYYKYPKSNKNMYYLKHFDDFKANRLRDVFRREREDVYC